MCSAASFVVSRVTSEPQRVIGLLLRTGLSAATPGVLRREPGTGSANVYRPTLREEHQWTCAWLREDIWKFRNTAKLNTLVPLDPFRPEVTVESQYNRPFSGFWNHLCLSSVRHHRKYFISSPKGCPQHCGFHLISSFLLNSHWWCHRRGCKQHVSQMTLQIFHSPPLGSPRGKGNSSWLLISCLNHGGCTKMPQTGQITNNRNSYLLVLEAEKSQPQAPAPSCFVSFVDLCSQFVASTGFPWAHTIEGGGSSVGGWGRF